jgi:hypothetical protein
VRFWKSGKTGNKGVIQSATPEFFLRKVATPLAGFARGLGENLPPAGLGLEPEPSIKRKKGRPR